MSKSNKKMNKNIPRTCSLSWKEVGGRVNTMKSYCPGGSPEATAAWSTILAAILEESHSGCGWEWGHSLAYSEFYLFSSISSNVIPHAQTPKCGGNQECGLRSPYSHLKFPQVATSLASREPARTVP